MSVEIYNLTTKAKVKEYLDITADTYDDLLDNLCNQITDFIEKMCGGRRFYTTEYTQEVYDGDDFNRTLRLNNYPVTSWGKIEYNAGTTTNPNWTEFNESDYEKYDDMGYLWFDRLEPGKRNIRVSYTAGYSTIPYDLELLATKLVARIFEKRLSEQKSNESSPDMTINWDKFLQTEDERILLNYTRLI